MQMRERRFETAGLVTTLKAMMFWAYGIDFWGELKFLSLLHVSCMQLLQKVDPDNLLELVVEVGIHWCPSVKF